MEIAPSSRRPRAECVDQVVDRDNPVGRCEKPSSEPELEVPVLIIGRCGPHAPRVAVDTGAGMLGDRHEADPEGDDGQRSEQIAARGTAEDGGWSGCGFQIASVSRCASMALWASFSSSWPCTCAADRTKR